MFGSRALAWFLPFYAAALLFVAPRLSLWLDEVLTLSGALEPTFSALLENLEKQQGATPLAFLIPQWAIRALGFSLLSARLPSILAAVAACPAIFLLARRAGLRQPIWAVLVFALWPLQFRYALEVRPYSVAVCLAAWATVAILERWSPVVYALLTLAMGLTHPYALFVPAAHLVWLLSADRKRAIPVAIALALPVLVLIPWYAHFSAGWRAISEEQQLVLFNWRAALVFLREISGAGYIGAAILFTGIALAARHAPRLWWIFAAVPILAVPVANIAFNYFFAVRQLIYVLPILAILFTGGAESFRPYGRCLTIAFLIASVYANITWITRPREDWAAATNAALAEIRQGACVRFVADSQKLFVVFQPALAAIPCPATPGRIVLLGSTYEIESEYTTARAQITALGLTKKSEQQFLAPTIEVYGR